MITPENVMITLFSLFMLAALIFVLLEQIKYVVGLFKKSDKK